MSYHAYHNVIVNYRISIYTQHCHNAFSILLRQYVGNLWDEFLTKSCD